MKKMIKTDNPFPTDMAFKFDILRKLFAPTFPMK